MPGMTIGQMREQARQQILQKLRAMEDKFVLDVTNRGVMTKAEALELVRDHRLVAAIDLEDQLDAFERFAVEG